MKDARLPVLGFRRQSGVATITLTNGPANALSNDVIAALDAALDDVAADAAVRAIVFDSAVDGFFAAGADLKLLATVDDAGFTDYLTRLRAVIERIGSHPCVSIAAIEGQALGGGRELALACTFRIASSTAKLGVPEVKLGLLPGAAGTQRLPQLIGRGPALELLLSGRSASGDEAAALGLVDRVVKPGGAGSHLSLGIATEELSRGDFNVSYFSPAVRDLRPADDQRKRRSEETMVAGSRQRRRRHGLRPHRTGGRFRCGQSHLSRHP